MRELYTRVDPDEWLEWIAYWQLEPFGGVADDERFRLIATLNAAQIKWPDGVPFFFDRDPAPIVEEVDEDEIEAFFEAQIMAAQIRAEHT